MVKDHVANPTCKAHSEILHNINPDQFLFAFRSITGGTIWVFCGHVTDICEFSLAAPKHKVPSISCVRYGVNLKWCFHTHDLCCLWLWWCLWLFRAFFTLRHEFVGQIHRPPGQRSAARLFLSASFINFTSAALLVSGVSLWPGVEVLGLAVVVVTGIISCLSGSSEESTSSVLRGSLDSSDFKYKKKNHFF